MKPPDLDDPPPSRPIEPTPDACCGEGCAHCVLDLYDAALEKYEADSAAWHARHMTSAHERLK
ncbi:MAG: oxidoreductase-like domain-containing protein [Luteimonas sp.]